MDLNLIVENLVQSKINNNEPFTSACISHALIDDNPNILHREINEAIRNIWHKGKIAPFKSSVIIVYPNKTETASAVLYHPVGYDINNFRVLKRRTVPQSPELTDDSNSLNDYGLPSV